MSELLTPYNPPRFIAGLDIGQTQDPSALAVLERDMRLWQGQLEPWFFCGHLERVPLQTPYPAMVTGVRQRLERIGERCVLVIDATGVGKAIVDLFRVGWTDYDALTQERRTLPGKPSIIAVTITNAEQARNEGWDTWYVPKREVIMALMVTLQQHRLEAAATLEEFPLLVKEGQNFQWKVSQKTGDDLYGQWRAGEHDDLLFAVAIAVWYGAKYAPRYLPTAGGSSYAVATGNPLMRPRGWSGRYATGSVRRL